MDWNNTVFVDVREPKELETGKIKAAINIPLSKMRKTIASGTLDKSKTYIIICAVGKRAYLGTRIMLQNGYKAKNFAGGIATYNIVKDYIFTHAKEPHRWAD